MRSLQLPCDSPLDAWRVPGKTANGKAKIVWGREAKQAYDVAKAVEIPCGRCTGCRLEKSRQWAVRIMHELQMHEASSFLTLTYAEMPKGASLNVEDVQRFLKRLRDRRGYEKLRFYQCGEYGEKNHRPHHHMILFGCDWVGERERVEDTQSGFPQWESQELTETWGHGRATIGEVSFESAAYVARYALKKVTGKAAAGHYSGRRPEFATMSRRPGIGAGWLQAHGLGNTYNHDRVVMRGREMLPPKFYDKLLEKSDPRLYEQIKRQRRPELEFSDNPEMASSRLIVRETVRDAAMRLLKRGVE